MNLLLLLSALLSALTGIGASARSPERAQAVAEISIGRAAAIMAPARAASRPASPLPAPSALTAIGMVVPALVRLVPLWEDRRRE